ncbi:MAG: TRAP transporter small permease subunit, partial [Verrucomicrobiia bacterium]
MENADSSSSPEKSDATGLNLVVGKTVAYWGRIENWLITFALGAMMLLPLLEIILRQFRSGISGSAELLQHLVLFVAMLGGAIAARENRLLSLSTFTSFLKGPWKIAAQSVSSTVALFVTFTIGVGCYQFITTEGIGGNALFAGLPSWVFMSVMPIGFGLLAVRILWLSGDSWRLRLIPLVVGVVLFVFCTYQFEAVESFVWPLLILLIIGTVAGAPLYVTIGGAALIMNWGWGGYFPEERVDIAVSTQAQTLYSFIRNPLLVTLPLFTLAGYFLAQGHSSKRLIRLIQSVFGGVRGGAVIVTVVVCAFFTTFTG